MTATKTLALLAGLVAATAWCQTQSNVTVGEYLDRFQTEGPRRLVEYCSTTVPSIADDLRTELTRYKAKVAAATEPIRKRNESDLSKPVPTDVQASFDTIASRMVEAAQTYEPGAYCSWLLGSLRRTTVESLRSKIEEANARYESLARSRSASAPK